MERGDRLAVDGYIDGTCRSVVNEPNAIPSTDFGERCGAFQLTNSDSLASEHVKDAIVYRLLCARVHGQMRVIEMRAVVMAINDDD